MNNFKNHKKVKELSLLISNNNSNNKSLKELENHYFNELSKSRKRKPYHKEKYKHWIKGQE